MPRRNSATETTYIAVRDAIVQCELRPGQPLFEEELAEKLHISRTPVREALRLLSRENLVRIVPGRGAFVTDVTVRDLVEVYQMRQALEGLAAQLAAAPGRSMPELAGILQRFEEAPEIIRSGELVRYDALNHEMDHAIALAAGNRLLHATLGTIWQQAKRLRQLAYQHPDRLVQSAEEHKAILRTILAGNAEGARIQVVAHIQSSLNSALAHLAVGDITLASR